MPFGVFGAGLDFAHGLGKRLALIQGDVASDRFGALARKRRDLAHDCGALERRGFLPAFEGALRGGERPVEVFTRRVRKLAQHFPRRGVEHRRGLTPFRFDENTVNI